MSAPKAINEYTAHQKQVKTVNDIFNGSDSAKAYLEQFEREDVKDFETRQNRSVLDNYVLRTVNTRKDIIMRKDLDIENIKNTELFEYFAKDIDLKGTSANEFFKTTLVNAKTSGFSYVLVDTPKSSEEIRTKADEQKNNIRPYAINIKREDLFYWRKDSFGNYTIIAFNECYEANNPDSDFDFDVKNQIKVFFKDGRVQIYREDKMIEEYQRGISFITLHQFDDNIVPELYDMAKLNIAHLNTQSEKRGYVRSCQPFPILYGSYASGGEDGVKTLSFQRGLHLSNKQESGFEYAEVTGQAYNVFDTELTSITQQMDLIGINYNTDTKIKTATQVNIDNTPTESKLTDDANMLENGINKIVEYFGMLKEFDNFDIENNKVLVNKDFSSNLLSPEQQDRLIALNTLGRISNQRLNELLVKGEILSALSDDEQAKEDLLIKNGLDDVEED